MADLPDSVRTTGKVQSGIDRFESLSLSSIKNVPDNSTERPVIIALADEDSPGQLLNAVTSKTTTIKRSVQTKSDQAPTPNVLHKQSRSAKFIEKTYLNEDPNSLADDAREILQSQPGIEEIEAVLTYIRCGIDGKHNFNIKVTDPRSSRLVHTIITITLPDLWPGLSEDKDLEPDSFVKKALLDALFSAVGIGAILDQIRRNATPTSGKIVAGVYLSFLSQLLHKPDVVLRLLEDLRELYGKEVQRRLFWQNIVSLLSGSKILSVCAETPSSEDKSISWLSNGEEYSRWLAGNIVKTSTEAFNSGDEVWTRLGALFKGGLSLGYKDVFVTQTYTSLILGSHALWSPLHKLLKELPLQSQKIVFDCILNNLQHTHFSAFQDRSATSTAMVISGAAALVDGLVAHNEFLLECATDWVSRTDSKNQNSGLKRSLIIVLAQSKENLARVLERSLSRFSDGTQIQHMPMMQQEHLAQSILLAIGNLHRLDPESLKKDPIPTLVMRAVTNRLSSSVPRIRLLGMVIGVGMSKCIDPPGKVMDFHVEEMETQEVKDLIAMIDVQDRVGTLNDLKTIPDTGSGHRLSEKRKTSLVRSTRLRTPLSRENTIEELSSPSSDENDLVPYPKPINDPEDSDEDPTLIDRNKPRAPIYIVDLIKQLQSSNDKLEVAALALHTAASLVKRKADFGSELSDNVYSLTSALINLQDSLSRPQQQQQRLDALVACLVARPATVSKHIAAVYFSSDLSLSQRSAILTTIGLGARQLTGYTDINEDWYSEASDEFPSRDSALRIHPRPVTLNTTSTSQSVQGSPVAALSNIATQDAVSHLALAAAEYQAGPKVLQINRSSSSLSNKRIQTHKKLSIPKGINLVLTNDIYLPLASPLTTILSYLVTKLSSPGSAVLLLHPSILALHLQTLTLLLHTLGPTGLSPPQNFNSITHETVLLLANLSRSKLSQDGVVLPALLGLFLGLIDITVEIGVVAQERLLSDEFGDIVSDLVRWVAGLEQNGAPPPVNDDDVRKGGRVAWTVLAAGIQVRWMEIGKRFQGRMLRLGDGDV